MYRNIASQKVTLLVIDTSTNLPMTGDAANLTFYVAKDDGTVTALTDTSATELSSTNAKGLYTCDLTQGETDAYKLVFSGKSTTTYVEVIPQVVYTQPANFDLLSVNGSGEVTTSNPGGPGWDGDWDTVVNAPAFPTNFDLLSIDGSGQVIASNMVSIASLALEASVQSVKSQTDKLIFDGDNHVAADLHSIQSYQVSVDVNNPGEISFVSSAFVATQGGTVNANVTQINGENVIDDGAGHMIVNVNQIYDFITDTYENLSSSHLDFTSVASAVRTELTTELGRIDVATSTRLASASYTAPLTAATTRTAIGLASANLDTQLSTIAGYIDTEVAAIKAKTDLIPASPAAVGSAMTLTSGERDSIADALLVRNVSNVEGSAPEHSLCTVILAGLECSISGTTMLIKRTDGTTTHATKTLTKTEGDFPIRGIT